LVKQKSNVVTVVLLMLLAIILSVFTCMWGTGIRRLGDPPPNVTSSR